MTEVGHDLIPLMTVASCLLKLAFMPYMHAKMLLLQAAARVYTYVTHLYSLKVRPQNPGYLWNLAIYPQAFSYIATH